MIDKMTFARIGWVPSTRTRRFVVSLASPLTGLVLAMAGLSACGGNKFGSSRAKSGAPPPPPAAAPQSTDDSKPAPATDTSKSSIDVLKNALSSASASGALPGDKDVSGDVCAQTGGTLRVFILDLKSGWFAGDGGDTFKTFVMPACGGTVEFVYAHMTKSILEGPFLKAAGPVPIISCAGNATPVTKFDGSVGMYGTDLDSKCTLGSLLDFQQVWILSGSLADPDDVSTSSSFFSSVKTQMSALANSGKAAGFFFGTGLGNVDHANLLSQVVLPAGVGAPFALGSHGVHGHFPDPSEYASPSVQLDLKPAEGLAQGTFRPSHALTKGLSGLRDIVPDNDGIFGSGIFGKSTSSGTGSTARCVGDVVKATSLDVIAVDPCGQKSLAASILGNGHRVVLEANMVRFYVTKPEQWFNRIVNWLALAKK